VSDFRRCLAVATAGDDDRAQQALAALRAVNVNDPTSLRWAAAALVARANEIGDEHDAWERVFVFMPESSLIGEVDPAAFLDRAQAERYADLTGGHVHETILLDTDLGAEKIAEYGEIAA
jgi:hypothetical protein